MSERADSYEKYDENMTQIQHGRKSLLYFNEKVPRQIWNY
uniref:Uncharacterized protein n=1 Tax=Siphoviridae sp. ct6d71 TaxID=2826298 RepID=A0A8S5R1K3_9CAUD|nr:MAG TPA: hypothetical protein [Siphoviridae sp. ct6d71]